VWLALLLVLLLGMVGLVIDAGLLMATHRQAQNAADAAALAAADDLMYGRATARDTAKTFVKTHNGLPMETPDPEVYIPPEHGPYAGVSGYAEVIVTAPMQTFFIHILGVSQDQQVRARAVAGSESYAAGEGVVVLDPTVTGLEVGGTSSLRVLGRVAVNSEGSGVDENGNVVDLGTNYPAATAGSNSPAYAREFHVVGGVHATQNVFLNVDPNDSTNVLHCRRSPVPDPLLPLPTPTTTLGVDPTLRGTAQNWTLLGDQGALNTILNPGDPAFDATLFNGQPYVRLHPGVYDSITITTTDVNVYFVPGIYVVSAKFNNQDCLTITGGTVTAAGVMFYNTGHNFNPETGAPDDGDKGQKPPAPDYADLGGFRVNERITFTPIDTKTYDYRNLYPGARTVSSVFDGMLFYQRRRNPRTLNIEGESGAGGKLEGTLYAKWALVAIAGSGTYDAQFVVGSMYISGGGVVTVNYTGSGGGNAPAVYLVE